MTKGLCGRWASALALTVMYCGLAGATPREPAAPAQRMLMLVANPQKGATLFQDRCAGCHSVQENAPQKIGPPLHGLFGRRAGSVAGYKYSAGMSAGRIVWDAQTLDRYLADPHRAVSDARMPYPGLSSKVDRDDIISYLDAATR